MPNQERISFDELIDSELKAEDAVRVVEAVQENGYRLLPATIWIPPEVDSSPIHRIYDRLLQLDNVDDFVKSRVRWIQKIQKEFDRAENEVETSEVAALKKHADEIIQAIGSEDRIADIGIANTVTNVRRLRREGHFRNLNPDPGLLGEDDSNEITELVVEMTTGMMDEGQKSIFWPPYVERHIGGFAREDISPMGLREKAAELGRTAAEAAKGAIAGGLSGAAQGAAQGARTRLWPAVKAGAVAGFVYGAVSNTVEELKKNAKNPTENQN